MAANESAVAIAGAASGPGTLPRTRARDLFELCVGYGLILAVLWTPRPWQRVVYVLAVGFLTFVIWRGFESIW